MAITVTIVWPNGSDYAAVEQGPDYTIEIEQTIVDYSVTIAPTGGIDAVTVESNALTVEVVNSSPEYSVTVEVEADIDTVEVGGSPGPKGDKGDQGDPGEGVPVGGDVGQVIKKLSSADFDTGWQDESGGGGAVDSVNGQVGVVVLDKADVGLGNVDNTSDLDKPISTATQTALDGKKDDFTENTAFNKDFGSIIGTVCQGNDARLSDSRTPTAHDNSAHTETYITSADVPVDSVNGEIGVVVLDKTDIGLSNVDNTSDADKPVSTAQQTEIDTKEYAFSKNTAFNKNFGATSGTVCEGDDSRLSDDRDPTTHDNTSHSTNYAAENNVLTLDNTTTFTPDADYEPATKKYVDDNSGGGTTKEYASFYLSTGGVTGVGATATTLVVNNTSINSDTGIFSLSSNVVTADTDNDIEVLWQVSFNNSSTSRSEYTVWLERGTTEIAGTRTATYQRGYDSGDTASGSIIIPNTSGDNYRLRIQRTDGAATTGYQDDNGTRWTFKEM